jgi:ParB family chromosome partitioning protein
MEQVQEGPADVRCDLIDADFNYRRRYKADSLAELRDEIKSKGRLIHRVTIRPRDNGRFQLVVGNRRYRAFVDAFGAEAPIQSEIRILTDQEATEMIAAENHSREDPSVIEDAELAARMVGLCKGDRAEAAKRLRWAPSTLASRLGIMNATQKVRDAYLEEKIGVGHVEIFAALRKEVQDRVLEVMLQQPTVPTVDQLKAMAEQSLMSLEAAIFDRAECAGCQFNTGNQQALFEQSFTGSRCTNKECYGKKTEDELEARKQKLTDTYQVVRIVRTGDNSTVIPLRADGKRPVGEAQAKACRTCGDFGACVSAVPDSMGKVYEDICFNKTCNDEKVAAFNKSQEPQDQPDAAASSAGSVPAKKGGTTAAAKPGKVPAKPPAVSTSSTRGAIKEYRESIWRKVFERAMFKLPVLQSRALLLALIAHRPSYLNGSAAMERINKELGTDVPVRGAGSDSGGTQGLMRALLAFDQEKLAKAYFHVPAQVTAEMPIRDLVGFLTALDINIEQYWKVNETFFDILTKTELDAVCQEIGLAKAAGKTYDSLKNGKKADYVKAMLKVDGFRYEGAVPQLMRWSTSD